MNTDAVNSSTSSAAADTDPTTFRCFSPTFEETFASAIEDFGGSVFAKLGWRAPRDTENWLHGLEINNMEDFLTAFKSSGILTELLEEYENEFEIEDSKSNDTLTITAQDNSQPLNPVHSSESTSLLDKGLYIILKKHYTIHKHLLVRCFVRSGKLIGIC